MSFEITDHVPGLGDEQVAAMVEEAEGGYDLSARETSASPHFQRVQLVPADLLDAIDQRAAQDRQSPEAVVRQALANYLHTA
ncbi:ribbon-helix-helix protein, CopG family [Kribbia dieselivorans]|uniref:ribbon-helix-helix protein, CopG family n=1 Tax=Kribbia dieselivorans TaxID=331526 RepID=UPI000838717E|nr:ribbon-helix-helix protein, CopG family [Kribbia dieselivorans]